MLPLPMHLVSSRQRPPRFAAAALSSDIEKLLTHWLSQMLILYLNPAGMIAQPPKALERDLLILINISVSGGFLGRAWLSESEQDSL